MLFRGPRLEIGPTAQIAGRVRVIGQRNADVAQGAKLAQPVEFEFQPLRRPGRFGAGTFVFRQILAYGGAFLCGLLLIKLFPGLFAAGRKATQRVGLAMSVGALVLISGIALVIFAILLMIVGTGAGVATLTLYVPILYGSQVFVGACVGEMILHKSQSLAPSVGALALGLLILRLLVQHPVPRILRSGRHRDLGNGSDLHGALEPHAARCRAGCLIVSVGNAQRSVVLDDSGRL